MSFADFKLGQLNPFILNGDLNKTKTIQPKTENAIDLTSDLYQPTEDVDAIDTELADIMAELGMEDETAAVAGTLEDISANSGEAVSGTLDIVDTELVNGSEATNGTSMSDEAKEAIKAKMEALQEEYDKEVEKMEQIKEDIEELSDKVAENITKAAAAQEQAVKENEQQAQAVVDEQLKAYIEANQEGGEGMTREQLQENIKGAMPDAPNVSAALAAAIEANEQISEIDALLGELNTLTAKVKPMEDQLNAYADILDADDAAKEAEGANGENGGKKCDPIGFEANGQEYNFFTDKDNDGALSQTNEFLGADKQWEEMTAADVDGNGTVTAEELEEKGIQMAGADGTIIKGADAYKEAFGENFSIDLNSYDENGTYAGMDTTKDSDNDGTVDQELLGTFNVNVNGSEVQGYNTLDDVDWLSENYGVEISETAGAEGAEEAEEAAKTLKFDNVQGFIDFAEMAAEQNELAKEELAAIEEGLGFNTDTVAQYKEVVAQQATGLVSEYVKSLGEDENEDAIALDTDIDADATAEQQEIKAAEDTTANETQTEEELREELEEEAIAA